MPEYRVEFKTPGKPCGVLFETEIGGVETAQDARVVALGKLKRARSEVQSLGGVWIEIFEVPDEVLVLRMPADLNG